MSMTAVMTPLLPLVGTSPLTVPDAKVAPLAQAIRKCIKDIANQKYTIDPLLPPNVSHATSRASAAYKRHGRIIEQALCIGLSMAVHLDAWTDTLMVPGWPSKMQVDLFAFDTFRGILRAYEIKRGGGAQDSGSVKNIRDRLNVLGPHLPAYGRARGLSVRKAETYAVALFGELGNISPHVVLKGAALDAHFGAGVMNFVAAATNYYRHCLNRELAESYDLGVEEFRRAGLGRRGLDEEAAVPVIDVSPDLPVPVARYVGPERGQRHPWDDL